MTTINGIEINTKAGIIRIWKDRARYSWATPNGSQGERCCHAYQACEAAFEAEGLNAEDFGVDDWE